MEAQEGAVTPGFDEPEEVLETTDTPREGTSFEDELVEARERLSSERDPLELPVPGYGGKLVARYKVLDGDTLKEIAVTQRKLAQRRDKRAEYKMMCDTLAKACVGIFRPGEGEELVPLEEAGLPALDGVTTPIRYDVNLAKLVRYPTPEGKRFSARQFVLWLFAEEVALIAHYDEVSDWMTSAREEDDEDFSTRSPATSD